MESSQETPIGVRTYRYSLGSLVLSLVGGAFAVTIGLTWLDQSKAASGPLLDWAIGIGTFLVAAYLAISAAYSVVLFDRETVTLRGVLNTQSIRRRSVSGYLVERRGRAQVVFIRLISKSTDESDLVIRKCFAFDDAWRQWISSLPDLTKQRKEEEDARFTLK
jgi:hypothetical protein